MKKKVFWANMLLISLFAVFVGTLQSCSNQVIDEETNETVSSEAQIEELNGFTADDLRLIQTTLIKEGKEINADVSEVEKKSQEIDDAEEQAQAEVATRGSISTALVRIYKISKSMYVKGVGNFTASGVLLVPRATSLTELLTRDTKLRIIVAPPATYIDNESAPSNLFKKSIKMYEPDGDINMLYFYALQAMEHFAVFIPDYPGFGDSNGQTYNPYVLYDPLVESTYKLLDVAREKLTSLKKKYKPDVVFTGYSGGAYTAMALARASDLQPAIANVGPEATIVGGTPIDLMAIFQDGIKSDSLAGPHVYGYAAYAYYKYYSSIDPVNSAQYLPSNVLGGAYSDVNYLADVFGGTKDHGWEYFASDPQKLFSQKALTGDLGLLGKKLDDNAIKPWKNTAPIYLIHGTADDIVYYNQVKDFKRAMDEEGGERVLLSSIPGLTHVEAAVSYFVEFVLRIQNFR